MGNNVSHAWIYLAAFKQGATKTDVNSHTHTRTRTLVVHCTLVVALKIEYIVLALKVKWNIVCRRPPTVFPSSHTDEWTKVMQTCARCVSAHQKPMLILFNFEQLQNVDGNGIFEASKCSVHGIISARSKPFLIDINIRHFHLASVLHHGFDFFFRKLIYGVCRTMDWQVFPIILLLCLQHEKWIANRNVRAHTLTTPY